MMPTIVTGLMDIGGSGGGSWSDLVNLRTLGIAASFGTFANTYCSIT